MIKRLIAFFVIGYFALQIPACTPWRDEVPEPSTKTEITEEMEDILEVIE